MSFSVQALGTSAMYATVERAASGYLVRLDDKKIWLDAGAGTWRALLAEIPYEDIDGVILTHRHPDHTTDVFQAYHARRYGAPEPLPNIPLWAPAETIEYLTAFIEEFKESFDLHSVTANDSLEVAGAMVNFVSMAHPPETLGVRIEKEGKVFAYSADSGEAADFGRLASRADVFLCEATLQDSDEPWEGHLSAAQAGSIGAETRVERLVLTHLPPGRDHETTLTEARGTADRVSVELALDGMLIELVP
jgi:ribonuclease BN (tRNA processing enzyme)